MNHIASVLSCPPLPRERLRPCAAAGGQGGQSPPWSKPSTFMIIKKCEIIKFSKIFKETPWNKHFKLLKFRKSRNKYLYSWKEPWPQSIHWVGRIHSRPEKILAKQSNSKSFRGYFLPLCLKKSWPNGLIWSFWGVFFTLKPQKNLGQMVEARKIRLEWAILIWFFLPQPFGRDLFWA